MHAVKGLSVALLKQVLVGKDIKEQLAHDDNAALAEGETPNLATDVCSLGRKARDRELRLQVG